MPRSTKLKDDNAGLRDGVHKLADCICCDKKNIRSDNFKVHFQSHLKKSSAKDVVEFSNQYQLDLVEDVLIKAVGGPEIDKIRYPYGVCYACHKVIYNKDPRSMDDFCNHLCKEKKEAVKKEKEEERMKSPPDFKALWEKIGKNKMSDAARIRYDDMPEICSDESGEEKYNLMISYFVGRVLSSDTKSASAPSAPVGKGLMALKKVPELMEKFQADEDEDDILASIIAMTKNETNIVEKFQRKLQKQEKDLVAEIDAKNCQLSDVVSELNRAKDNIVYYAQEARNSAAEIQRLKALLNQNNTITHMD